MARKTTVTGVYGGSFNPIHLGHTQMAEDLIARGVVDEVWFVVSPQNPLKDSGLWNDELRLRLAKTAVEVKAGLYVSNVEFGMPRPNYMACTLDTLSRKYPDREFVLIIGMDNWDLFDRWYNWQEIINGYRIMVLPRKQESTVSETENIVLQPLMQVVGDHLEKVDVAPLPLRNVSSTWIREQIRNNPEYDGQWLDSRVWSEIRKVMKC